MMKIRVVFSLVFVGQQIQAIRLDKIEMAVVVHQVRQALQIVETIFSLKLQRLAQASCNAKSFNLNVEAVYTGLEASFA